MEQQHDTQDLHGSLGNRQNRREKIAFTEHGSQNDGMSHRFHSISSRCQEKGFSLSFLFVLLILK